MNIVKIEDDPELNQIPLSNDPSEKLDIFNSLSLNEIIIEKIIVKLILDYN